MSRGSSYIGRSRRIYRQIEEERGRPLITYATSSRPNAEGVIASDVIPEICRQILRIPSDKKVIDLLVVSRGGDPIVSWRIISLLRERFEKVNVLVPYEAYSAATLSPAKRIFLASCPAGCEHTRDGFHRIIVLLF
jgi:hypothetical protein